MTTTFLIQNGDVVKSGSTSRPQMIADSPKLSQDLTEASNIATQPNGFGFGFQTLIGKLTDPISLRSDLNRQIRDGVEAIKRLQNQSQRGQRPDEERVTRLTSVNVTPVAISDGSVAATSYAFQFAIATAKGDQVATTGILPTNV